MADFESELKPPAEPDSDKTAVPSYALVKVCIVLGQLCVIKMRFKN